VPSPPAKRARHSPEAKPMADGQGEAAWGTSGQVTIGMMEQWKIGETTRTIFNLL